MEDNGKHFSFEEGCLLLKQAKYKYKYDNCEVSSHTIYILVAVGSSETLKVKQKLGVTFNSDKLGGIDFTNFSKLTMCSA